MSGNGELQPWELPGAANEPQMTREDYERKIAALKEPRPSEAPSTHGKPDGAVRDNWPEPKVISPDITSPTGIPYIDCLLHRLLDAQQDINFHANETMSQSVADAALLIDEVEATIRKLALRSPKIAAAETSPGDVLPLGGLFNELVRRMNFDGMDPRSFTLGELERAIDRAEFPK